MSYPYDAATTAALARCETLYNGNAYNPGTNPGGMAAGGHRINFVPALQDVALIADSVADAADAAALSASSASTSATSAANEAGRLNATSTTSVSIGTGSKSFTTQTGKSLDVGTYAEVVSAANPSTHYMAGQVTAYNSGTGALTMNVLLASGSGSRSDWTIYGRTGAPGAQGLTGGQGVQGETPSVQWTFGNGTTDSDPGNGVVLINNATYSAATLLFFDNLDRNGATATAFLDSLDDSTNTSHKGTLFLQQVGASTVYAMFTVTGTVVDATGYRRVPVSHVLSNGSFTNGQPVAVTFQRTGNAGADGAGAGDTISDISSVADGRLVIYNGTTGKHITNASFGIGTSGANIGALSTANTWSGAQSLAALLDIQQDLRLSGDITPTQITSNQDNYAPSGNATASVFRLSTDASRDLTGIANGADGRILIVDNVGSFDLVLKNDVTSTPANRFLFGFDFILLAGQGIALKYDPTAQRWKPLFPLPRAAWTNARLAKTANHTVVNVDKGKTLALGGSAFFTLTLNAPSGYDADFAIVVENEDSGRAKRISPSGITSFLLWPKQVARIFNQNGAWIVDPPSQRWRPTSTVTFNVDPVNGLSTNDGLATGAGGAVATIQQAVNYVILHLDPALAVNPIIQLADGTYTAGAFIYSPPLGTTTWCTIQGNASTPSNVLVSAASTTLFDVQDYGGLTIKNLKLAGAGSVGINARQFCLVDLDNIDFGSMAGGVHVNATDNSLINYGSTAAITGDAAIHVQASNNSRIVFGGTTTIASARAFTIFANVASNSVITGSGTFTGAGVAGTTGISSQVYGGSYVTTGITFPGSARTGSHAATADGTAAQPFFGWEGDLDSGIYRAGANNPAMSSGGAKVQGWSTAGTDIIGLLDISGATSGQIRFPASQNASSNANTLDDYEEGTFVPVLTIGGTADSTYTTQLGRYVKVGKVVHYSIVIAITNNGAGTGNATITGLPFTAANVSGFFWAGYGSINTGASAGALANYIASNSATLNLNDQTFNPLSDTTIPNASTLIIGGQYEAAN